MRDVTRGGLIALAMSFCVLADAGAQNVGVQQRLKELESDVATLKKAALASSSADLFSRIDALAQRVDALSLQAESRPDAPRKLDNVEQRLQKLSEDVASLRAGLYASTPAAAAASDNASGLRYDSGLTYSTSDDKFSIRMLGMLQVRYTGVLDQDFAATTSSFQLRRARLDWDGHAYGTKLKFKIKLAMDEGKMAVLDYFIAGSLPFGLSLTAGQFKVPFSRGYLVSSSTQWFLERPNADNNFRFDRDIGVQLGYGKGNLLLRLGVFNGAGKNVAGNDNIDPLLVLRADVGVLGELGQMVVGDMANTQSPNLTLGAAVSFENMPVPVEYGYGAIMPQVATIANRDVNGDGEIDNVQVIQATADAAFRLRGVGLEGSVYARKENWGAVGTANGFDPAENYWGGFFQASYFLTPQRFQLGAMASYSQVSPLLLSGRTHTPASDVRLELTFAAAYYRFGNNIELTGTYSFFRWMARQGAAPSDLDEHVLLVETQFQF